MIKQELEGFYWFSVINNIRNWVQYEKEKCYREFTGCNRGWTNITRHKGVTVCTRIGSSGIKLLLVFYNKYSLIATEVLQTLQKSKV